MGTEKLLFNQEVLVNQWGEKVGGLSGGGRIRLDKIKETRPSGQASAESSGRTGHSASHKSCMPQLKIVPSPTVER
jgi:hypothetical protein